MFLMECLRKATFAKLHTALLFKGTPHVVILNEVKELQKPGGQKVFYKKDFVVAKVV